MHHPAPRRNLSIRPANDSRERRRRKEAVFALLERAALKFPESPACVFQDVTLSYARLHELALRFAAGLHELGVRAGDRVGLHLANTPHYPVAFFGCMAAGAVVVNLNPLDSDGGLAGKVVDSQACVLVTSTAWIADGAAVQCPPCLKHLVIAAPDDFESPDAQATPARAPCAGRRDRVAFSSLIRSRTAAAVSFPGNPEQVTAVLQYTGGTTGIVKAAMLSHASLSVGANLLAHWFTNLEPGRERGLVVLPLTHGAGLVVMLLGSVAIASCMVLHARPDPDAIVADLARRKITWMMGVPTLYAALSMHPALAAAQLAALKLCICGAAPLATEVKTRFESRSGCRLIEGYALTECVPLALNPVAGSKPGSVGLPLPGVAVDIVHLGDPACVLPAGQIGQIRVGGPTVMQGYWNNLAETAAILRDGRVLTGDAGKLDEEGYLFIVDRLKDVIITSGVNVYPRVVEEVLHRHPGVLEVLVAGLPDSYRGETVAAFIVARAGVEIAVADLEQLAARHLSKHERPRRYVFRTQLPRSAVGKLLRKELLAQLQRETGGAA